MFVNRNLIPHRRQRDWFDLTNQWLCDSLALMDDNLWPVSRRPDQWALTSNRNQQQLLGNDPSKFEIKLDVSHFKPEEINVKVVGNSLVVEGKHEERQDKHGYVSRQFNRRYQLGDEVDMEKLATSLSEDGKLTISAPKKVFQLEGKERVIPITVAEKDQKSLHSASDEKME